MSLANVVDGLLEFKLPSQLYYSVGLLERRSMDRGGGQKPVTQIIRETVMAYLEKGVEFPRLPDDLSIHAGMVSYRMPVRPDVAKKLELLADSRQSSVGQTIYEILSDACSR